MSDSVKVTVCQLGNTPEALERQWKALCAHVRAEGSRFVLLPEMVFGPWFADSPGVDPVVWDHAESSHEQWMSRLHELGAPCVAGTRPVTRDGRRMNEAFVWTPGGGGARSIASITCRMRKASGKPHGIGRAPGGSGFSRPGAFGRAS